MPELPTISAADPTVVEERVIAAKTYDKLWLSTLLIQAFDVGQDATAHVELSKYNLTDGTYEVAPETSIQFKIENLIAQAAEDAELATIMGLLLNYVIKKGREQGVVAPAA